MPYLSPPTELVARIFLPYTARKSPSAPAQNISDAVPSQPIAQPLANRASCPLCPVDGRDGGFDDGTASTLWLTHRVGLVGWQCKPPHGILDGPGI